MRVEVKSKKGLRTILSVIVDKKNIQTKMNERLLELQKEVTLKGFRPGKVPAEVIKLEMVRIFFKILFCIRNATRANDVRATMSPLTWTRICINEYDFRVHLVAVRKGLREGGIEVLPIFGSSV